MAKWSCVSAPTVASSSVNPLNALGVPSLSRKAVLNGVNVSRPEECQFRMTNVQDRQKMLKNWRTHPRRLSLNNPWARRHQWDQLLSLPDDTGNLHIALPCVGRCDRQPAGTARWYRQSAHRVTVCRKYGRPPAGTALVPELETNLETEFDIQTESQAVLDSVKENDCRGAFREKLWDFCTRSKRDYVEGDGIENSVSEASTSLSSSGTFRHPHTCRVKTQRDPLSASLCCHKSLATISRYSRLTRSDGSRCCCCHAGCVYLRSSAKPLINPCQLLEVAYKQALQKEGRE
jgi:hypothetical protein